MIVYGDAERVEAAGDVADGIAQGLLDAGKLPAGIGRHAALVGCFIRAGELVQGLADAESEARGFDARSAAQDGGAEFLLATAAAIDLSWRRGFSCRIDIRPLREILSRMPRRGLIKTRTGEGFAHYALYPESYLEAARASGLGANTCVIGIRSIGIALGALVAAALGAAPAISLRPVGHPFDRRVRAEGELVRRSAADPTVNFAIADEGPGLSGSSLASVARWLLEQGVTPRRIHFFPSHQGQPGRSASAEIRAIWKAVVSHSASAHDIVSHPCGLRSWVEDKIGPLDGPLQDLSSARHAICGLGHRDERFDRQKFMGRNPAGTWLVKFAGLGSIGERKFRDATALAAAGFTPETVALCHGFLVQKWVEGVPLNDSQGGRDGFLSRLVEYLAFRARHLGPAGPGASLQELRSMAAHNTSQVLGAEAAALLESRLDGLESLQDRVRPIRTDNRLHAWEWMVTEGTILKLDAVDHCEAHDLIGCQDIAWDVAGSIVEHDLDHRETDELCRVLTERAAIEPDRQLIRALLPCYLAFQLGIWTTATPARPDTSALANAYAEKLAGYLRSDAGSALHLGLSTPGPEAAVL